MKVSGINSIKVSKKINYFDTDSIYLDAILFSDE